MSRGTRYRGQRHARRVGVVLLSVFALLVVSAIIALSVLPNYLVYSEDGQASFTFACYSAWKDALSSPTPPPADFVPTPTPTPTPQPTPTPTPAPTPTPRRELPVHAVLLPLSKLTDQAALNAINALLESGQADTVVIELKAPDGTLGYSSALPLAIQAQVSTPDSGAAQLIRDFKAKGAYVVAKVACFKDARLPQQIQTVGIKHSSGVNWLDGQRNRWLDPYKPDARTYLLDVMSEVAGLGADEILLDWVTFPVSGGIGSISYGADQNTPRHEGIETFLAAARETADKTGVALSVVLDEQTAAEGENPVGGQRLSGLLPLADRLYLNLPLSVNTGERFAALTETLAPRLPAAAWPARLVPVLPLPDRIGREALDIALDAAGGNQGLGWLLENAKGQYTIEP
ncbi:MAG: putative glycoside hydrolase [Oscillospiraceae bacterium]|jgi:hypothetical protein|nr:putative glycoside hydrolase [Oscillospiraceae bacterium]